MSSCGFVCELVRELVCELVFKRVQGLLCVSLAMYNMYSMYSMYSLYSKLILQGLCSGLCICVVYCECQVC